MTASSIHFSHPSAASYADGPKDRARMSAGLMVTILFHALILWLLLRPHPIEPKKTSRGSETGQMVFVAPLARNEPEKPKTQPPKTQPPKKPAKPAVKPPPPLPQIQPQPVIVYQSEIEPSKITLDTLPPDNVQPRVEPPEDMMAHIAEARKRRAAQNPSSRNSDAPPQEDENTRATRIARANIAGVQGKSGSDKDDSGGVFQIRNLSYHKAEFTFRGWNSNFRRNWSQQILVEQGDDDDIETATIKRMIELIRQYKQDDFIWESHRLGRQVPLNAGVAHTRELHQFLMREFFPDYRPLARR
jgi:hypothetical protein